MDILNDLKGNFLHTTVKKLAMRSGDTDRAKLINPKFFLRIAKKLSLNLKHVGNLDVDFLLNKKSDSFRFKSKIWRDIHFHTNMDITISKH